MPAANASERLTCTEAAAAIGVSTRTLSSWIAARKIKVVRLSLRSVFVPREEVERILADGVVATVETLPA